MLWLLPVFLKTALYLFGCPMGGVLSLFSNAVYAVCLMFVVPTYFLYAGPEAAVRFSLLLCVHLLLLAMVPRVIKLIIPMAELLLFVVLLFLPINVTPPIAVWLYEKLLYLSSPVLSVFEAIHIVLVIMKTSQMIVDQMEEHPNFVKSVILGMAALTCSLGSLLSYYIYTMYASHSINRIIEILVVTSLILLVLSLVKDEGIISEVPSIFFVMMCIVWALAKESAMSKRQIEPPSLWLKNIPKQLSFLDVITNMASNGLASFFQIKTVFFHLISPSLLLMTGVRVLSLGYILGQARRKFQERSKDSDNEEDDSDAENNSENLDTNNAFFSRVVVIFVFTELLLRAMYIATSARATLSYPSNEAFDSLKEFEAWWKETDVVKSFLDFRIWRIVQLCLLVVVYVYKLLFRDDDDDGCSVIERKPRRMP